MMIMAIIRHKQTKTIIAKFKKKKKINKMLITRSKQTLAIVKKNLKKFKFIKKKVFTCE